MRPIRYAENYHADELAFLRNLLKWVENNCRTRLIPEKLDLLRQSKAHEASWLKDDDYDYFMGVIDTLFLIEEPGSVLISDDLVIQELGQRNQVLVSSEKYLRAFVDGFEETILPVLLSKQYVGLSLDPQTLFNREAKSKPGAGKSAKK